MIGPAIEQAREAGALEQLTAIEASILDAIAPAKPPDYRGSVWALFLWFTKGMR